MKLRRLRPIHWYVAVVSAAGLAVLVALAAKGGIRDVGGAPTTFWLFSGFVLVGELFPISVPRRSEVDEVTTSTTFAFALMLGFGTGGAALALATASALADTAHRKPAWKTLFNVAQYTLSMTGAGWAYYALGGTHRVSGADIGAVVVSAGVFFLLNWALTDIALALAQGLPLLRYLVRDLLFQAYTAPALLALSPVVVVAAGVSLWLVPLLALPIVAVYWGATVTVENIRLVRRLEESLAHVTELNKLKDDFVAVVSHELRTPLTSIQGYVKTLIQLSGELGEEQRRAFLEAADRQGERLRRLIEQLLVVGRLESHVEPLTVSPVSITQLTRHLIDEFQPLAQGHTFDLRFDPNLTLVETDEAKVEQILSNLVENALKYSPPDTRVTIRGIEAPTGVLVSVEDEGPGIPPEARELVFERFYQVDQSTTRRVGGTGLGLYICKKMAETIGARVWLERSGPEGSVFCLQIPFTPPGGGEGVAEARPGSTPSEAPAFSR